MKCTSQYYIELILATVSISYNQTPSERVVPFFRHVRTGNRWQRAIGCSVGQARSFQHFAVMCFVFGALVMQGRQIVRYGEIGNKPERFGAMAASARIVALCAHGRRQTGMNGAIDAGEISETGNGFVILAGDKMRPVQMTPEALQRMGSEQL